MSLYITSLNSGSNGNCYYIANETEAVLVDAGISCRETEKRMDILGLSMNKVRAIFISHEHTDHIKGVESIAEKYDLPVYITHATAQRGRLHFKKHLLQTLVSHEAVNIGGLTITGFPKLHDAADPHSFIITGNGITVGVFTDIGVACENVNKHFKLCHAAFLEANYDAEMLENGGYPIFLKNRIRGGEGHLSNTQAMEIFKTHRAPFMSHLLLAHLSKDNNSPQLVQQLFESIANNIKVFVASRYAQTDLYKIEQDLFLLPTLLATKTTILKKAAVKSPVTSRQLSLF